ncbi:hypothetical protein GWG54_17325 [Natronococcus sp. JC468]|uniref:hypothetical protein n=1 Tax=Natronococcus sp. JC468 TaxID=1961921 RepID=UPI001438A646|nr:hypothetical protein [Natronococcus sp. JC468]NKE37536.1 hypothetical protein [Natronococcus sp. JC468]
MGKISRLEASSWSSAPASVTLLEIISGDGDQEYLIVEVKNSTSEDTIRRGIKETLEYLAFLRLNEVYVFGQILRIRLERTVSCR